VWWVWWVRWVWWVWWVWWVQGAGCRVQGVGGSEEFL